MHRFHACRAALSSSLALMLGAGLPVEQALAQVQPANQRPSDPRPGFDSEASWGFQMAPAAKVPAPAPQPSGLPELNGFQMIPATAAREAIPTAAETTAGTPAKPQAEPAAAVNGFQMIPASPAQAATPTAAQTTASAPAMPQAEAPESATGFQMIPASAAQAATPTAAEAKVVTPAMAQAETPVSATGFQMIPASAAQAAIPTVAQTTVTSPAEPQVQPAAAPIARKPVQASVAPAPITTAAQAPVATPAKPRAEPVAAASAFQMVPASVAPAAIPTAAQAPVATPAKPRVEPAAAASAFQMVPASVAPAAIPTAAQAPVATPANPRVEPAATANAFQMVPASAAPEAIPTAARATVAPLAMPQAAPAVAANGFQTIPAAAASDADQAAAKTKTKTKASTAASPASDAPPPADPAPAGGAPDSGFEVLPTVGGSASQPAADAGGANGFQMAPQGGATAQPASTSSNTVNGFEVAPAPASQPSEPSSAGSFVSTPPATQAEPPPAPVAPPPAAIPPSQAEPAPAQQLAPAAAPPSPEPAAPSTQAEPPPPPAPPPPAVQTVAPAVEAPAAPPPAPPAPPTPPPAPEPAPAPAPPPPAPARVAHPVGVVGRIIVQGNERIEASTITSYLPIQPGDEIDAPRIDLALKTLHRTDLFADESIELQGTDLIVRVSENPIVNQVVFEGNHALKEDKLRDEVTIRPRGIFTRTRVEQDAQKIIELYRRSGRISATVTPKIVHLPQKRVDLIFEINEGPKSGILNINIIGNKSYSDNALRDVVVTRESHWYKFFQQHDSYDPDQIEYDREQLRKFYRNHGFYDFRIISAVAEMAPEKNGFVVTFTIDEGPKYHFGKLKVETQLKRLNGELLQALLPIREGQLYEDERIEKATDGLTYAAGANGFAFVDVRPRYVAHPDTKTVDVTFDIKEGPRVYIERIDIVGNTRTLDQVIRRELRVAEGDAYNRVLVDRSKNQVKALGFFKDVDIEQVAGSAPDKTVLRVKVTEQPTGQLTFSLGYSSIEKLVGDVGISEANFRGRGQRVDFQVSLGYLRKQISLAFTEPRFMGRNMSAGFNLYTFRYNYSTQASFQTASTGLQLTTGFPINQFASIGLRYTVHTDNVTIPGFVIDPVTGQCVAGYSQSLCDEVGSTLTSSVGYSVRWDRRNDPIIPTRGFYFDFGQDFAGLGGDVKYIRTSVDGAWYYGFTPAWIFSLKGQAGYINGWGGDIVRINDRFFKGGDTFRGFQIAGIGPRDVSQLSTLGTPVGDALGGKLYAIGTAELTVPTPIPAQYGIKTALFADFGTLGLLDSRVKRSPDGTIDTNIKDNLALRASAGLSVFWKSPMGPLEFDFSKVLSKAPYDRTETFRFNTTTRF